MMPAAAPRIVVYCRVWFGAGHWVRIAALMTALVGRFRVTAVIDGALTPDLRVPDGVDRLSLPPRAAAGEDAPAALQRRVEMLHSVLEREQPRALVLEYFPFGRVEVAVELTRWLHAAKKMARPPLVVCSLRDIQQRLRPDQPRFDRDAVSMTNRYFDALLVHADPAFVRFSDTFAAAATIKVPVHHTGYVVSDDDVPPAPARDPVIVVSAGGGRGGDGLLLAALAAQRDTTLSRDFSMRLIAGTFVAEDTWRALQDQSSSCERFELRRWVPDLRAELGRASVSVSRCGYNTALDLVRSRVPALVVPYATPHEDEQTERAARLERAGFVRVLSGADSENPDRLAEEIRRTARFEPHGPALDFDGTARSAALMETLVAASPEGGRCTS